MNQNNQLPADIQERICNGSAEYLKKLISQNRNPLCYAVTDYIAGATAMAERMQVLVDLIQEIIDFPPAQSKSAMSEWIDKYREDARMTLDQWKEGKDSELFKGSVFSEPAPGITLGCISPEARELLDKIMEEWGKHYTGMKEMHGDAMPETTFYGFAYWLIRWSGLIQPALTNQPK